MCECSAAIPPPVVYRAGIRCLVCPALTVRKHSGSVSFCRAFPFRFQFSLGYCFPVVPFECGEVWVFGSFVSQFLYRLLLFVETVAPESRGSEPGPGSVAEDYLTEPLLDGGGVLLFGV